MAYDLNDIGPIALTIIVAAVVIGVGATVTSELSTDLGYNATNEDCLGSSTEAACNAVENGTSGLGNLSKRLPLMGTIIGLAVVLGVVFTALYMRQ